MSTVCYSVPMYKRKQRLKMPSDDPIVRMDEFMSDEDRIWKFVTTMAIIVFSFSLFYIYLWQYVEPLIRFVIFALTGHGLVE